MPDERTIYVPYVRIDVGNGRDEEARKGIIAALNIQMNPNGREEKAPFIKPRSIARKSVKRLTIYGTSGCGKTKCLLELISSTKKQSSRIYIINPKGLPDDSVKRTYLASILSECSKEDMIVWDNFPEGLEKKGPENAKLAIKTLSSYEKPGVLIALTPEYVEREGASAVEALGINAVHLKYSQHDIRKILASAGKQMLSKEGFAMIVHDLSKIALVLWQIEPTPKAVLDYLGQLAAKAPKEFKSENPLALAGKFSNRSEYYKDQFEILRETRGRKDDVEFLYTVKICYELGLDRSIRFILALQRRIFGSRPDEGKILRKLQLWLQQSAQEQVSFHDIVRHAILLCEATIRKVISFLAAHYADTIPLKDQNAYLFGSFVGTNCHIATTKDLLTLLPKGTKMAAEDIRSHRFYQIGLGHGIGRMTANLGHNAITKVLGAAATSSQFGRNLGEGIGWEVMKLRSSTYRKVFDYARENLVFSRGVGIGVGMTFPYLSSRVKKNVFVHAERNIQFADGLGTGVGAIIEFVPTDIHPWLFLTAELNSEFARGLGTGLGHNFVSLAEKIQLYALSIIKENSQFARGLGIGLGDVYAYLPKGLQEEAIHIAKTNSEFSAGYGIGIGYSLSYLSPKLQESALDMVGESPSFAYGAGVGVGIAYHYLNHELQGRVREKARRNARFTIGIGEGYGLTYAILPKQLRQKAQWRVEENENIALGFGMGTGYGFDYLTKDLQAGFMKLAASNEEFAKGFGFGLARNFESHSNQLKNAILLHMLAEEKKGLAFGIGHGLGFAFEYLSQETRKSVFGLAGQNAEFAAGLGKGIGTTFNYYSEELQQRIIEESLHNLGLSRGIREGTTEVLQYLDKSGRQLAGRFV